MRVGRPGIGTGAAEAAPQYRPNWVALLTDACTRFLGVKKAAVAGGLSAYSGLPNPAANMWQREHLKPGYE